MTTQKDHSGYIERAKKIYEEQLKYELVKKHKGYIVKVDGRSGKYALGISASQSLPELKQLCDNSITYTARIGSDYVYELPNSTITDISKSTRDDSH